MKENIKQTLTKATFEVFEKMFFVFLEPVESIPKKYDRVSVIDFGGKATGTLALMMTQGMAETMAQNMLGCDSTEVTVPMIEDCCREAANMVCGNFLRKMSEQDVFNLSLPRCTTADQAGSVGVPASADNVSVVFESEDESLQLCLSWKESG